MTKPFESYTFDDAANLVGSKVALPRNGTRDFPLGGFFRTLLGIAYPTVVSVEPRRTEAALRATLFYLGEHWQDGNGFIGQLPPMSLPGAAAMTDAIRKAFVADNVIKEVVKTHVGGILGREPVWSFLKTEGESDRGNKASFENQTGETLTRWWNDRKALKDLQKAVRILVCEGRVVRRLFIPRGRLKDGAVNASNLLDALDLIYFQTVPADLGGVFTDPETQRDIGIFLFDELDDNNDVISHCAELSYLDDDGNTVCKVVKDKGATEDDIPPYPLGGRLLVYEMTRDALITEQIQSNQRALNLAHTQMIRNVNLAGNRQQTITNAQPPLPATDKPTITDSTTRLAGRFPGTFKTGPGAVNFLMGVPIKDEDGNTVGWTDPNINISDPVSVETFKETISQEKEAIYAQAHQRHVLIVDKADTSGRAREVARREYERSLKESKTEIDACGRWQLETTLRLAAYLSNQVSQYAVLRADFNTLIDAGDPDPEKQAMAMQLRQPGGLKNQPLISDETARNWAGVEDAAAELARIEQESKLPEAELPSTMLPVEGQQTPKPATETVQ